MGTARPRDRVPSAPGRARYDGRMLSRSAGVLLALAVLCLTAGLTVAVGRATGTADPSVTPLTMIGVLALLGVFVVDARAVRGTIDAHLPALRSSGARLGWIV